MRARRPGAFFLAVPLLTGRVSKGLGPLVGEARSRCAVNHAATPAPVIAVAAHVVR